MVDTGFRDFMDQSKYRESGTEQTGTKAAVVYFNPSAIAGDQPAERLGTSILEFLTRYMGAVVERQ